MSIPILKPLLVVLSWFVISQSSDAAMTKLSVAYSTFSAAQAPAWIAKDRGLFEKYGLDVQLLFIRSSSIGVPALMSGAVPIAVMGGSAAVRANPKVQEAYLGEEVHA